MADPLRASARASQRSLPAVWMRGGTSKALFFHAADLPPVADAREPVEWNAIFCAALGSPDPRGRQLDGMGGGQSSLSKVAVVAPPSRPDADVDFTFAQVGIADDSVGYRGNCGNISSAVGPFALDEGLVRAHGDAVSVRIRNTNTGKLIVADFGVVEGKAAVIGDYELAGVPGRGAPIRLSFVDPGGAATGKLLPTGNTVDALAIDGGETFDVSIVDAANPLVCVRAAALGLTGAESPQALREDAAAMARFEAIRIAAAVAMGLAADPQDASTRIRNLPLVALLADPGAGGAAADTEVALSCRMISAGLPHGAIPLTGAMGLAVAARIPGTLAHDALIGTPAGDRLRIGHASGVIDVAATVDATGDRIDAREAVVFRTARRLMDGRVYYP
jgi:2-methylaconitate cis-trans-isomerase PrpF